MAVPAKCELVNRGCKVLRCRCQRDAATPVTCCARPRLHALQVERLQRLLPGMGTALRRMKPAELVRMAAQLEEVRRGTGTGSCIRGDARGRDAATCAQPALLVPPSPAH